MLLGKQEEIERVAASQNLTLPEGLEILDPDSVRKRYIAPMVALRKHKGLSEPMAAKRPTVGSPAAPTSSSFPT